MRTTSTMACMQYIAFDFETSGLPEGRRNSVITRDNLKNFDTCRAVSLSAARFSQRGRIIDTFDAIVLPTNFTISQDSIDIHGITQEKALKEGRPFTEVFTDFIKFIGPRTKTMIAHNAAFDTSVLRSEILRHDLNMNLIDDLTFRCTLQLYKERFLKPIRLGVLYKDIFGVDFENAHNSLADCIACGRVYPYVIGNTKTFKPLGIPRVVIGASNVSTAIGIGFKRPAEYLSDLWKKYSPDTFESQTKEEKALEILATNDTSRKILEDAMSFKSERSDDVNQKIRSIFHQIEKSGIASTDMAAAKDYLSKTLSTNHGTKNEHKTANSDRGRLIEDDTYYSLDICEIEGTLYQIVGRVDRIQMNEDGSRTLVEIKNRTKDLFRRVRNYEEIQCQTYLQMMDDIEFCRLIEQYNEDTMSYMIQRDDEKWKNEIFPKLVNFCEVFHDMLSK